MRLCSMSRESRAVRLSLLAALIVYAALAVNEIDWGAPQLWHPDEKQGTAQKLIFERTVNPGHFAYGGLPYYMLALGASLPAKVYAAVFDPRPDGPQQAQNDWQYRQSIRMLVAGRLLSVVLGAGVILITFAIGRALFDSLVGVVAAATLAVSPYFVAIAHFAIVDMAGNFWYWLAMLAAVGIYRSGERGWYVASGLTLGLATGVKVDRLLGALPLLVAHLLRREGPGIGRIVLLAVTGLAGYLLANLAIFTDFFLFVQGTLRDLFFNLLRESDDITPYATLLGYLADGLGVPLLVLAGIGLLLMLATAAGGRCVGEILWLLSAVLPAFWLFGAGLSTPWYAPFFFPATAIMAGFAVRWGIDRLGRPAVALAAIVLPIAMGWALLQTVTFNHGLATDARYRAADWLAEHAPAGSLIEIGPRAPYLDRDRFRLTKRWRAPEDRETFQAWRERLENHAPYQHIRATLSSLEARVSEALGTEPGPEYRAWFDFETTPPPAPDEAPDYAVMVLPLEEKEAAALAAPGSGYGLAARFEPVPLMGRVSPFPFTNPEVLVFRRDTGG